MALDKKDKDFRFDAISHVDFKQIEMDRVLTKLFPLIYYQGRPGKVIHKVEKTIEDFTDAIIEDNDWFIGFQEHPEIVKRWVETDLLDLVNRGKKNQSVAAPRPLHGSTYRFRNDKKCRDYDTARHLYSMLFHARGGRGTSAIEYLKKFFFEGLDNNTGQLDSSITLDVETQAILRFVNKNYIQDIHDPKSSFTYHPPLCLGSADILADDIIRLLVYKKWIPRSVMVEYLKILFAFHLCLYHLRLLKIVPELLKSPDLCKTCTSQSCPAHAIHEKQSINECPCNAGILVDITRSTSMKELAERSAGYYFQKLPGFIEANFTLRKLMEFNENLIQRSKRIKYVGQLSPIYDLLSLLEPKYASEREKFFGMKVAKISEEMRSDSENESDPIVSDIMGMGLDEFKTYIEILVSIRGNHHRQYITECLDSFMLKNRPGALIAQQRTKNAPRRFILDSKLLEVLVQIAVLKESDGSLKTTPILIDDLLTFLQERYGIYISELPPNSGFSSSSMIERQALRENVKSFKKRLQEIGFYRDLSDASATQTVTPRYQIDGTQLSNSAPGGGVI